MYESSCSYQTALDLKRTSPIAQVKSEECFGLAQCSPDWASYRFHQSTFEQLKQSVEKAKAVLQDRTSFLGTSAFSDIYSTPRLAEPLENVSSFAGSGGIIGLSSSSTSTSGNVNVNTIVSQRQRIETLKTISTSTPPATQSVDISSYDSRHRQEKSHGSSTTTNGMNNALRSVKCEDVPSFLLDHSSWFDPNQSQIVKMATFNVDILNLILKDVRRWCQDYALRFSVTGHQLSFKSYKTWLETNQEDISYITQNYTNLQMFWIIAGMKELTRQKETMRLYTEDYDYSNDFHLMFNRNDGFQEAFNCSHKSEIACDNICPIDADENVEYFRRAIYLSFFK